MDLGPSELLIILAVVLVLFGGKKLPELARSLGSAKKAFEDGQSAPAKAPVAEPAAIEASDTDPSPDTPDAS
jgi:sec-independent protein translocase protein TatA